MINTYQQAIDYVFGRLNYERMSSHDYTPADFKLARMQLILNRLGNPELKLKTFHVAGTKGKGSTCHWLAHCLQKLGYKVGLFTSPHLTHYEERFSINGEIIGHEDFVQLLNQLIYLIKSSNLPEDILEQATFFEITTALAWLHFYHQQVDYVVLEVGMGGLYDTTNICRPIATAITSIDFDHMRVLGNTIPEIALQKAGIIKAGVPVICAAKRPEACHIINQKAQSIGSKCLNLNHDFSCHPNNNSSIAVSNYNFSIGETTLKNIVLPLLGEHQAENLVTALAMLKVALPNEFLCLKQLAENKHLFADVKIPLRIEIVRHHPTIVLDAAHNPLSIRTLLTTLKQALPLQKIVLIFGCSKDKDIIAMLNVILTEIEELILTQYTTNPRNLPHDELREICLGLSQKKYPSFAQPEAAYNYALSQANESAVIAVTGSFFLAAELRSFILQK